MTIIVREKQTFFRFLITTDGRYKRRKAGTNIIFVVRLNRRIVLKRRYFYWNFSPGKFVYSLYLIIIFMFCVYDVWPSVHKVIPKTSDAPSPPDTDGITRIPLVPWPRGWKRIPHLHTLFSITNNDFFRRSHGRNK